MATLQDAINAIQDVVGGVSGIRSAPDYAPDQLSTFPFALAFARTGTFEVGPVGMGKGLHTIVVEVHVARKDLPRDIQAAMAFSDAVPLALLADTTLGGVVSTFTNIRYEFGPMLWGKLETLGFRFYVEGIKLQTGL
jgi:hypothetical protein